MFSKEQHSQWISLALIALILMTRSSHFGTHVHLPDATLAALFIGGLTRLNMRWLALAITVAFAVDFYALGFAGVSDYCMSLGYWGLIPTYAMVWAAGRFVSKRQQPLALTTLVPAAWLTTSLAFVMSNAFWYAFSDKVNTLSAIEFTQGVAQYYMPYLGYTMFYLGAAWLGYLAIKNVALKKDSVA